MEKNNKLKNIAIYHPSKAKGGAEILFSRVIELCLTVFNFKVAVIDYRQGILSTVLKDERVTYYAIEDDAWIDIIDKNIILCSARNIMRLLQVCKKNNIKYFYPLFWILHPAELYSGQFPFTARIKSIFGYYVLRNYIQFLPGLSCFRYNIKYLLSSGALRAMDHSTAKESEWVLKVNIPEQSYLPLITNLNKKNLNIKINAENDCLNLAVISRLDDFKVNGIIKLIKDIRKLNNRYKIKIHLVGNGHEQDKVLNALEEFGQYEYYGEIKNTGFDEFFQKNNIHILFAMGTTALEGASRAIPTVILPCTDQEINSKDIVYKYIYEQKGYSLGEYINSPFCSSDYKSLELIIAEYFSNPFIKGELSQHFFIEYYSSFKVDNLFLEIFNKVNCVRLSDFKINAPLSISTSFMNKLKSRSGI